MEEVLEYLLVKSYFQATRSSSSQRRTELVLCAMHSCIILFHY